MFARKLKIVVLVSLVAVMTLTYAGCSSPFKVAQDRHETEYETTENLERFGWLVSRDPLNISANSTFLTRPGIVTTLVKGDDEIISAARQPDGRIVAVGSAYGAFGLVRYTSTGSLDESFGTGGKVTTRFSGFSSDQAASSLVIQPDGKIVVAGMVLLDYTTPRFNHYNFGLARYNADGSLDTTFGTNGLVITDIASDKADVPVALALQSDGKIVAAGFNGAAQPPQIPSDFVLARYNSNGSLDTSFGTNGIVITDFNNDVDFASSLVIQPDGKLIAGGWTYTLSNDSYDFALARYTANGTLDASFGSGGKVVVDMGNSLPNDPGGDLMTSMVLQPDGKILCAGTGEPNRDTTLTDFVIGRFNPNGTLDTSFGTNGEVVTDFDGSYDFASSIALEPDGKFVVVGVANGTLENRLETRLRINYDGYSIGSPTTSDFAVARYNPDGSLDLSFGTGGKGQTDVFGSLDAATKVLIMPNGNILALGYAQTTPYTIGQDTSVVFASVMYKGTVLQRRKLNDFDGDGKAELAIFRPSEGTWYIQNSFSNSFRAVQFGVAADKPVAGDYDGDGLADIAVFRNGIWFILRSSDNALQAVQFGTSGDEPVQDDYDGDGKTDIAVYRPSDGTWYLLRSTLGFAAAQFGVSTDIPVNGDYDGDGRSDVAVYRPSNGTWYRLNSSNGAFSATQFGIAEDKPVVGDYDGDGIYDLAVFRPSSGTWYLLKSHDGFGAAQFGIGTDVPIPADYDGDQVTDVAVYRPSDGNWYTLNSTDGFSARHFGSNGDIPIPAR